MKDLLNFHKKEQETQDFDAIKVGLASLRLSVRGLLAKSKSPKPSITVLSSRNVTVCSAPKFLAR